MTTTRAAAVIVALAACHARSEGEVLEAGARVDRDYAIGAFQRIAVSGPYEVEVRAAGSPSVKASGGENFLDQTDVVVEDGQVLVGGRKQVAA